eukprot:CAMPEP_0184737348 /NCGR_PEP_ID=MMETSP0315-20130426/149_1 /TAXON_ID=101924 /ORGANISM="Rhodosorus marinus, Strain UTEX LB 2760" /LENGTH=512 /DNA_ID=CAMNT_0027204505 /DNA_START=101 /DNA_END=1640 /DNA_ORIENTATION=-
MGSESVHVKVSVGDELRRFAVERNVTYEELMVRLGTLLGPLGERPVVSYVDDEGDMVNVTSTLELQEAVMLLGDANVLRLKLHAGRESGKPSEVRLLPEVPREVPESANAETGVKVEFENAPTLDSRPGHSGHGHGHGHGHGRRGPVPGWRGGRGRRRYGPYASGQPQQMPGWNEPGTPWPWMDPFYRGMSPQSSPWGWQSPQAPPPPPPPPPPGPHHGPGGRHGPGGHHGPPPFAPGATPPYPYPFGLWDTGRMAMKLSRMWQMVDDEVRISLHNLIQELGQSGELGSLSSAVPEIWPVVSKFGGQIPQGAEMPRQEEIDSFEDQLRFVIGTRISASSLDLMMAFMKTALQQRAVRKLLRRASNSVESATAFVESPDSSADVFAARPWEAAAGYDNASVPREPLFKGDMGPRVVHLHYALNRTGYIPNGELLRGRNIRLYGGHTVDAVAQFQKDNGLEDKVMAPGVYDALTREMLMNLINAADTPETSAYGADPSVSSESDFANMEKRRGW